MRLKSRENFIPEGFQYYCPQIPNWRPQPWSSLHSLADQVIELRRGNPFLAQKHGWSLDKAAVLNELDEFNANLCAQMGWTNYIIGNDGGAPIPKHQPPSQQEISKLSAVAAEARNIYAGLRTISEWLDNKGESVAREQANARAAICAGCSKNGMGEFGKWFIAPAAAAVKRMVEKAAERKLTTDYDEKLGICEVCTCSNRVKVHCPIEFIKGHTKDDTLDKLRQVPGCWVVAEIEKS